MSAVQLEAIRDCLDGRVPAVLATCSLDGIPNSSYVSQVHYIDSDHVALTFQFFNKTRANVLSNPRVMAMVADPATAAKYRIRMSYLRTETSGPVFENMKAKLSGIASHTGMSGIFHLQGADIYQVLNVTIVPGQSVLPSPPRRSLLPIVRAIANTMQRANDLAELLDGVLNGLEAQLKISHSMIHWLDESGERLYAIASRGYSQSGAGSEIQLGQGVIGTAASMRTPIRINHATAEYTYSRAARESARQSKLADRLEAEIPAPGLASPGSQMAVPIVGRSRLLGVLYVEDAQDSKFGYDEEDALVAIAQQLALAAQLLDQLSNSETERARKKPNSDQPTGQVITVRHYASDDTIFVGDNYLIKGVAGAILCKLLSDFITQGRLEFTNRELRLDPTLPLPDLSNNLEARLILLKRRLADRCPEMALENTGRGRFKLRLAGPVKLVEAE